MDEPRYLGTADLARRWSYTTRGVRNLILNELDFPAPAFSINAGRIRVWTLADIEAGNPAIPRRKATAPSSKRPSIRRPFGERIICRCRGLKQQFQSRSQIVNSFGISLSVIRLSLFR